MPSVPRLLLLLIVPLGVPALGAAQSPTLPSDTLEANFAPRGTPGPMPELAPSLPSDTLRPGEPVFAPDSTGGAMRRDWNQEEDAGEPWKTEEETGEATEEAPQFKLG